MDPSTATEQGASERNAVALARIEERIISIQAELARQAMETIPHGHARLQEAEVTNRRQWVALVVLSVGFTALTGETILPFLH